MALQPLRVHARCVADSDTIKQNIEYCCTLGLQYFVQNAKKHALEAVLVGSGPSVKTQINKLKSMSKDPKYRIFGIKGGHDFLLENGIEPAFGVAVDPLERIHRENFMKKAERCIYFIASQCHRTLFDTLIARGEKVVIWHLMTDSVVRMARDKDSPIFGHCLVHGGSTSGLRCIVLAYLAGFRKIHLFGYDSCLSGIQRKVNGETYEAKNEDGTEKALSITAAGKKFKCDPAFASQLNEFQELMKSLYNPADPFTIRGYGEGAIQALIKERYRQGAAEALM